MPDSPGPRLPRPDVRSRSGLERAGSSGLPERAAALGGALRRGDRLPRAALDELLGVLRRTPPAGTWHPTGFVVLSLHASPGGAVRLHLWPAGPRRRDRPCWPVHDHTWDLRSEVLCGTIQSRAYAVHDDPGGDGQLYAVDYATGRSSVMRRSPRRVRVEPQPPRAVHATEAYEVRAGDFHASEVDDGQLAATLVATRPTERTHPWVVGVPDGPPRVLVERPVAEPSEVGAMLDAVLAALP